MLKKLLLLSVLLAISAFGYYIYQQQLQQPVATTLKLFGNIDIREAQLAFNSSEHIDTLFVEEGDRVTKVNC
ncbi:MAG: hypothetical protein Q9N32_06860 [Gammaproteobacteria bacterium]|nr:hypothetical protein [Gammaproteobacteria bacterium]